MSTDEQRTMTISPPKSREEAMKLVGFADELLKNQRFRECHDVCLAILETHPEVAQAHLIYAINAYSTQNWAPAKAAFETVLQADARHGPTIAYLSHIYEEMGDRDRSEACLKATQGAGSGNPLALEMIKRTLLARANNQLFAGELPECAETLSNLLERSPRLGQAHWLQSRIQKTTDRSHIEEMLDILTKDDNEANHVYLHYAIGTEEEELGNFDDAFAAYAKGAVLKRQQVQYDDAKDAQLFAELEKAFTAEWLEDNVGTSEAEPVFIVGMPRSGTTLVERMITAHSMMTSAGELPLMTNMVRATAGMDTNNVPILDGLADRLNSLHAEEVAKAYSQGVEDRIGISTNFVDKYPHNFLYVPLIKKAFPNAKIIHVKRDPMDCCFSNFKLLFGSSSFHSYDLEELGKHYRRYQDMMEKWEKIVPEMITVTYEDFVSDFETQAKALIAALSLDWEDACLSVAENEADVTTASAAQVREAPHTRTIGTWQNFEKHLAPLKKHITLQG